MQNHTTGSVDLNLLRDFGSDLSQPEMFNLINLIVSARVDIDGLFLVSALVDPGLKFSILGLPIFGKLRLHNLTISFGVFLWL